MAISNYEYKFPDSKCQFLQGPFLCDIIMLRNETYWLRPCFVDTAWLLRRLYQKLHEIERSGRKIWSYHLRKSFMRNGFIASCPKDCDGTIVLISITKMSIPLFRKEMGPEVYSLTLRNEVIELVLWVGDNRMASKRNPSPGRFTMRQEETYVVYIDFKFSPHMAWPPPQ